MKSKILNVVATDNKTLSEKWKISVNLNGDLYIRSNYKGAINWEVAPVYSMEELNSRGNFNIIKNKVCNIL